jgi:penicillin amidase
LGADRVKNFAWPNSLSFLDWLIRTQPKGWLPKEFASYGDLLRACDAQARENLAKRLGADPSKWTYGEATKARFSHPLASLPLIGVKFLVPPFPQNGNGSTPNVGAGVSMRHISTPGNWDETRHGIALGESGDPASPHFSDQLDEWKNGNTEKFPFTKEAVEAATKSLVVLKPL